MDKPHLNVGMSFFVCPVCGRKHSECILVGKRLLTHYSHELTNDEFAGWELCDEDKKLFEDGYIALVETTNQPEDGKSFRQQDAIRTGRIAHIRKTVFPHIFSNAPVPDGPMCFTENEAFNMIQKMHQSCADKDVTTDTTEENE